jgi:hypothetical protein
MQDESLPTPDSTRTAQIAPDAPEHEDAGNGKLEVVTNCMLGGLQKHRPEVVTGCMVRLWLC